MLSSILKDMMINWTSKEDRYLKSFYVKEGATFCAKNLGRSRAAVYQRAGKLKLKIPNDIFQKRARMARLLNRTKPINNLRAWRRRVLFFGNYKCLDCGLIDPGIVVAHHLDSEKDRFQLKNGGVLCPNCHARVHMKISFKRLSKPDIQKISDLFLKDYSQEKICNFLKISRHTLKKYLKKAKLI